ncbi:MAG: preprotein translocase subunit YajC [Jiangellaceae bacterium]|nr:preprotein translocase subunit YajC [Jiangellaceae bacterium]
MEALLLPILLFAVFYFILIRPQQRQRRELMQVQSTVAPGARVMTGSGLIAQVVNVDGDEVDLEVAPGVTNRYVRRAIVRVFPDDTVPPGPGATDEVADDVRPADSTRDDASGTPA